jgi:AraC-like DNA-binding protein
MKTAYQFIGARRDSRGVRLYTRNGYDFADRFPKIVEAVAGLPVRSCYRRRGYCGGRGWPVRVRAARYRLRDHAGRWITLERLRYARELLERDVRVTLEDVAATSGFGSLPIMRHHFRKNLGTTR